MQLTTIMSNKAILASLIFNTALTAFCFKVTTTETDVINIRIKDLIKMDSLLYDKCTALDASKE